MLLVLFGTILKNLVLTVTKWLQFVLLSIEYFYPFNNNSLSLISSCLLFNNYAFN
ncbi:Uncharacterized protein dnl_51230 [Desulfonema limicola]|uniref:Uncharacterized protein n=1 Tax=Desulfonema limicola TaxID=45656 RepID=A0A975BCA6_9BACT|nr:Uncharacterized protein dnl_51230 [Desulfonema limicola]